MAQIVFVKGIYTDTDLQQSNQKSFNLNESLRWQLAMQQSSSALCKYRVTRYGNYQWSSCIHPKIKWTVKSRKNSCCQPTVRYLATSSCQCAFKFTLFTCISLSTVRKQWQSKRKSFKFNESWQLKTTRLTATVGNATKLNEVQLYANTQQCDAVIYQCRKLSGSSASWCKSIQKLSKNAY